MKPLALLLLLACPALSADPIMILSWNVESGGADPAVISDQLAKLPAATVFALQEVGNRELGRYGNAIRNAHGNTYRFIGSWTGQGDRLLFAFDEARLTLLETRELYAHGDHELNNWRHRSPLVCCFRDKSTGERLDVVTVHLARGDESLRLSQALGLSSWAAENGLPAIAIGDFNFDFNFGPRRGNRAFAAFLKAGVWKWIEPAQLVDTNWADNNKDGIDDYPDSCLDFAFQTGLPSEWSVESSVLVRPDDFPDDERTSDHRPIVVTIRP